MAEKGWMKNDGKKVSRVGVIGATRGFGYTLLAQIPQVKQLTLRAVCSRHTDECVRILREIGYDSSRFAVCSERKDVRNAGEDAIIIVSDYRLVMESGITALAEATGNVELSCDAALRAINRGINVYMASKETDSVCGAALNRLAKEKGVVYALVNGDQPRNLLDLCDWASLLGLEIIAAGKSSEYDFVWNQRNRMFTYLDGLHEEEYMPKLRECWQYGGEDTLEKRNTLLSKYRKVIAADLCEMNLVSNVTGLLPATGTLHYPILRTSELADVFIPVEDGGILERPGVLDVFYHLRDEGEASFCGGVFIIVRCRNKAVWEILASKGHVISRNGKYCCMYLPYHYMGLETPASILFGDLYGAGGHPECRQVSVLTARAEQDLKKGSMLEITGHHHEIADTTPLLLEMSRERNAVPYYLLDGATLVKDVCAGEMLTFDDVEVKSRNALQLYLQGLTKHR